MNTGKKQNCYYDMIRDVLGHQYKNKVPKAFVKTYGCQQNVSDGEKIKGMLSLMGYSFTDSPNLADFIIFNTCAIREHAEDRVFGNVGALKPIKKKNPEMIIALCGCMPEQEHVSKRIKKSFPFVDLVFGTHSLSDFPKLVFRTLTEHKRVFDVDSVNEEIAENLPTKRDSAFKVFIPVMYGCDNFCSYCIVPYVRGRERSRKPKDIINEVKKAISNGAREITLLGQNVNSYGKKLDEDIDFARLLQKIDSIDGDYRVRFMTSHPKDATRELIDTIASCKHICKQLHLPVQSGNDRILKAMNRHYTSEEYLKIIDYAKHIISGISITSDIIVGFPGETYSEFKDTLDLIRDVGYSSLFTFIYSKRNGTPAERMDDPITYEEKSLWFSELLKVQEKESEKYTASLNGTVQRILIDGKSDKDGTLLGRTTGNIITEVNGPESYIGTFKDVKITKSRTWVLNGEIIRQI